MKKIIRFILKKLQKWLTSNLEDVLASDGSRFIRAILPFLKRFVALPLPAKRRLIISIYFLREEFSEFIVTSLFAAYVLCSHFGRMPHKEILDLLVLGLAVLVSFWFGKRSRKFQFFDSDVKKKKK